MQKLPTHGESVADYGYASRVFRVDGHVYEIMRVRGEGLRVVEATPEEVQDWRESQDGQEVPGVALSLEEIQACVEGSALSRSHRIAALTSTRFSILFGKWTTSSYRHAAQLRYIGRRIPLVEGEGCGTCTELTKACMGCARRLVVVALESSPLRHLRVAAQHTDPLEQLRTVRRLEIEELTQTALSSPRIRRSVSLAPWDRRRGGW